MKTSNVARAIVITVVVAVQPCWAQIIDPATELRAPATSPVRHAFGVRNTGMTPEVIRNSGSADIVHRERKAVSPVVIEQMGRMKNSIPNPLGVR
ncbi:MAG TPA: hypothetical protein V6C76_09485 [Drouetiella sp.]